MKVDSEGLGFAWIVLGKFWQDNLIGFMYVQLRLSSSLEEKHPGR